MAEMLIITAIVALAGVYAWKKLSKTMRGKKACCEQGEESCAFKDFIDKEGNPGRLNCSEADREKRLAGKSAPVHSSRPNKSTN